MTKHTMVTLRLHRNGVILAVVFAILFAILIFVAGYLFGTRRGAAIALAKPTPPKTGVPKIVAPKVPTTDKAFTAAVAVRVGLFSAEADAKALVQRLAASKVTATIAPLPTDAGPTLYLVLVGRYTNRRAAAAAAAALAEEHELDTAVVPVE